MAASARWLRENAEHYLLVDAQQRVGRRLGYPPPRPQGSLKDLFWLRVFAPVYRLLPWSVRRPIMQAMPGSHRKRWTYPRPPAGPAV